ncbi:hypothetical protein psal_cds_57 [Pandoravirus salinus]|uniref:Uncharacterized protein n=1 Tax=Pandoravirus salinus TaxID=1349410 RepID=S4VVL6_9VIRU|nr:hypothetical protein psal_cds_57 [Pandoravirus salinus]AGO83456.1 hypothetical protein psal_cds_57 [Pandoravirus salinus]
MMQDQHAQGTKRRAPSVRPEVAAAVGLCGQPSGSLSVAQSERLGDVAALLGVPPATNDPCAALPFLLGDEWTDALAVSDTLVEEEAQRERGRVALYEMRRARARRGFYGTPAQRITPTTLWRDLTPELRIEVVERLADADARTILALYETNAEARAIVDRLKRDALAVDPRGTLVYDRVPLIDYARLAVALGKNDPTRLFLASALCSLRSLADLQVDNLNAMEQVLGYPRTFANLDAVIEMPPPSMTRTSTDRLIYSASIAAGLPFDQLTEAPAEYWETLARGMGPDADLQAALSGPLADDLPGVVEQWRDWTVGAQDLLLTNDNIPRTPIGARYRQILGWSGFSEAVLAYLLETGYAPLRLRPDGPAPDRYTYMRMRWLGMVGRDDVAAAFGRALSDPTLAEWMQWGESAVEATAALQEAIDNDNNGDRDSTHDLLETIAQEAVLYPASRACAVAQQRSRLALAPLENLLAQSDLWLVPVSRDFVGVLGDLRMPAVDEALAMVQRAPLS